MLLGPDVNDAVQRASQPKIKHSQLSDHNSRTPITNVQVKNIKAGDYAGFTGNCFNIVANNYICFVGIVYIGIFYVICCFYTAVIILFVNLELSRI